MNVLCKYNFIEMDVCAKKNCCCTYIQEVLTYYNEQIGGVCIYMEIYSTYVQLSDFFNL
jgi:hypothetical protein